MAPIASFECRGATISVRNTFVHAFSSEEDACEEETQPTILRSKTAPGAEVLRWSATPMIEGSECSLAVEEGRYLSDSTGEDVFAGAEDDHRRSAGRLQSFDSASEREEEDEEQPRVLQHTATRDWFDSRAECEGADWRSSDSGASCAIDVQTCSSSQSAAPVSPACGGTPSVAVASEVAPCGGVGQWQWDLQAQQWGGCSSMHTPVFFFAPALAHSGLAPGGMMATVSSSSGVGSRGSPADELVCLQHVEVEPRRKTGAHADSEGTPRTTVMLRNLPNNYSRDMLLELIEGEGFAGKFDFLYFPIDFRTRAAVGYAFLNLRTPEDAEAFRQRLDGFSRWCLPSSKVCSVAWSQPHQGLDAHVARYRNSPLFHDSVPDAYRPVLFRDGERVPFPPPTKRVKPPRQGTERMLV